MVFLCPKCKSGIRGNAKSCPNCGVPVIQVIRIAVVSQTLAIIGVFTALIFIGLLFDLAAIVCGIIALKKIKPSNGVYLGKEMAKTGIILSSIVLVLTIFYITIAIPNIIAALAHARTGRAKNNMYDISHALEKYYEINKFYPAPDYDSKGRSIVPHILTTPIPYLISKSDYSNETVTNDRLFYDPYKNEEKGYLGYGVSTNEGWILVSYGPDKMDGNSGHRNGIKIDYTKAWSDKELGFDLQASTLTWDPTNGINSGGDIWRRGP